MNGRGLDAFWHGFAVDPCGTLYQFAHAQPGAATSLPLGAESLLIVQDAATAEHVLREHPGTYDKNFGSFVALFGLSRLTADGDHWRHLQRLSQPFLQGREPDRIAAAVDSYFSDAAERFAAQGGNPLIADRIIDHAAAGVVLEVVFGLTPDDFPPETWEDLKALLRFCAQATWAVRGTSFEYGTEVALEAQRRLARLRGGFQRMLDERSAGGVGADTLVGTLTAPGVTDVDLLGEFTTLLFAGFDTTAASIGWALWLLAVNPKLQERLRVEIDGAVGTDKPAPHHLPSMPGLMGFVNEVLRIFPPVPILSRIANQDDEIGGVTVRSGQKILISVIGIQNDSRHWPAPMRARPERFAGGGVEREQRRHFIPFGDGPRRCGGMRFAMTELPLAIATLVSRLKVSLPGDDPLRFDWGASLRRLGGQSLIFESA